MAVTVELHSEAAGAPWPYPLEAHLSLGLDLQQHGGVAGAATTRRRGRDGGVPDSVGMAAVTVRRWCGVGMGTSNSRFRSVLQRRGGGAVKCGRATGDLVGAAGGDDEEGKIQRRCVAEWDSSFGGGGAEGGAVVALEWRWEVSAQRLPAPAAVSFF